LQTIWPAPVAELSIREVGTSTEFEALAPEWTRLWQRAPRATPFQAPAWLIPWWQKIGGGELRVLAARTNGKLVGLLPLYLQQTRERGKLLPLGIAISDYLDGLFEEGYGLEAAGAMLRRLVGRDDWRRCELHPLRRGSPLLDARAPSGCSDEVLAFEPCLVVEVPTGARELREVLPSKIRNNLANYRRRAERAGRVAFETATAATLFEFLEALFRLHDARWQQLGQPGMLADPAIRRFHCAAAPLLLSAGLLRLHALRLDERIVAIMYALHVRRRTYCYLCGFDPELGALSPGTLIFGHSIWQAMREGAREVDFLRGRERFKYFWGVRERPCYGRMLERVS
jgi:CelD/BcsL family acetyltransferase involved in cellulose biosynthesis